MQALKPSRNDLDGSQLTNVSADLDAITVNLPTDGIFGRKNKLNLLTTDKLSDMIDKIATHIEDITIVQPISEISISMPTYQAKSSMTGALFNVVSANRPITDTTDPIYYDNGGSLFVIVTYADNSVSSFEKVLVNTSQKADEPIPSFPPDNTGTTNYLNIITDEKSPDLYKLTLQIGGPFTTTEYFNAGPSIFKYQLKHKNTADIESLTNIVSFSVDNPVTPGITSHSIVSAINTGFASGIPFSNAINVSFQALNAVKAFYNKDWVAKLTNDNSSGMINDSLLTISFTPVAPPTFHPQFGFTSAGGATNINYIFNETLNILPNNSYYGTNPGIKVIVQNSKMVQVEEVLESTTPIYINTTTRNTNINYVDEVFTAGEVNRVTSGSGLYPATSTFGSTFDSSLNLTSTSELINFNNTYSYVNQDFTTISGPNYTNLAPDPTYVDVDGNEYRWVTFAKTNPQFFSRVIFSINTKDESNWLGDIIISNVIIMLCVKDKTPWFNVNVSNLQPVNEGDGCLDIINSSKFIKRCICSDPMNPVNGDIVVRFGIRKNSNVDVSGIDIS